jgi:hypothetical protein
MIIVTGSPRTGTSMTMQTIALLGYQVYGLPFPIGRDKTLNPKGYWEDMRALGGNISTLSGNIAVKVLLRKFIEKLRDNQITLTSEDKVILCTRDHDDAALSQESAEPGSNAVRNLRNLGVWYGEFPKELQPGEKLDGVELLTVNFENIKATPVPIVTAIKNFIGATSGINDAVQNIQA